MKKILHLVLLLLSNYFMAQNPGDILQNYNPYPDLNNTVKKVVIQPDGKIIAGGYFALYNGVRSNRIIRLNSNGNIDNSFGVGTKFDNGVETIVLQSDGKILVGGYFTTYNGVAANNIIRLNSDGSRDTSFNIGTGFDNYVSCIAIQNDGKIIAGGNFTTYNGGTANRIIRLNSDGSRDTSFSTGTGFNNYVESIAVQSDGKILATGMFINYNGGSINKLIRLNTNGTIDTSFIGESIASQPKNIILQNDGKILLGGILSYYGNTQCPGIIRLNTNGSIDNSFTYGGLTAFEYVEAMTLQNDGKIIIAGFTNNENRKIVRLNSNGTIDIPISSGTGYDSDIYSLAIQNDGKLVVGGWFTTYNDTPNYYLMRFTTSYTVDNSFLVNGTGLENDVYTIAEQTDGKIIVGGDFTTYNRSNQRKLIRFNTNGSKDTSFNTGTGFDHFVHSVMVQNDGKILVGGGFSDYNGYTANRIIRLNPDGTKDTSFNSGTGFNNSVLSITLQNDGKILVGGAFTSYNGTTENGIIRLNSDGTKDSSFNTGIGFNGYVFSMVVQNDGKIVVGGWYSTYNGTSNNEIIRLNSDGTKDNSFNIGTGFNTYVNSISLQSDGKILVGGNFNSYNDVTENAIIRLNPDGTKDSSFASGTGFNNIVYSVTIQNDGKILVGGAFTSYDGITANRIIRLNNDGALDNSFTTGTGFNNDVYTIVPKNNGKIHVGGAFISYKGYTDSSKLITLASEIHFSTTIFDENASFSLYPNPAKDVLTIQAMENQTIPSVKIFDLQGKQILESNSTNINISNLANGAYLAKIKTDQGEKTKKFVKE